MGYNLQLITTKHEGRLWETPWKATFPTLFQTLEVAKWHCLLSSLGSHLSHIDLHHMFWRFVLDLGTSKFRSFLFP